jgi:hypothetical protein
MLQAIVTKYHGPTNSRGSRISAKADAGRITVSYDYGASDPHHVAAIALCEKLKWYGDLIPGGLPSGTGNCYVFAPNSRRNATKVRVLD